MKSLKGLLSLLLVAATIGFLCACTGIAGETDNDTSAETVLGVESCNDFDWQLNSTGTYWYVQNVCYVANPVDSSYQTMSIFVHAAYLERDANDTMVFTDASVNGYTVDTAPILYACEAPGYSENKASSSPDSEAIARGFISVSPGHRGKGTSTTDASGSTYYDGKSPWCLIDLKAGIRYLRYNDHAIPGSSERIVTSASSGGGAMSSFLACCANDPIYDEYLEAAGAIMSVGDAVYASNCYCPITNIANSDTAYEWFLGTQAHLESLGCTDFQKCLSARLSEAFVDYLGNLGYTEEAFSALLIEQLEWSVNYYFQELRDGESAITWTSDAVFADANNPTLEEVAENYIAGHYSTSSGTGAGPSTGGAPGSGATGGPTSGGSTSGGASTTSSSEDISAWLAWDQETQSAVMTDLTAYEDYYSRQKDVTSFDGLDGLATENQVFGDEDEDYKHFSNAVLDVLTESSDELEAAWADADATSTGCASFTELHAAFASDVAEGDCDEYGNDIVDLYNPMLFIDDDTDYLNGDVAQYVRIRMGTADANTSLAIISLLGLALEKTDANVNFEFVWEGGHGVIEQDNQSLYDWIVEICAP